MPKKLCIVVALMIFFAGAATAQGVTIQQDTLAKIAAITDPAARDKKVVRFIKGYLQLAPAGQVAAGKDTIRLLLVRYQLPDSSALIHFTQSIYFNRVKNLAAAEQQMLKALHLATQKDNLYLKYIFLSHLGFVQTDRGNFIGAIYSYRLAKKEAALLKDDYLEALLDVNISDLYYKSGFHAQSLNYLDQALQLLNHQGSESLKKLSTVIAYNKSENYFRMGNYDSLKVYHQRLVGMESTSYKIESYRGRTGYYLNLLKRNYPEAIRQISALKVNPKYVYSELENLHLADAYFSNGQLDSARKVVNELLAITEANHPETKFHLYELLARIAQKEGNTKEATLNFEKALQQSQENIQRITQVGSISTQIRMDESESSYNQKAEVFKRERLWLIFIVIVAALIIIAIALIYRAVKQKRHYEKLLFASKREELAFINSHEVRKHLTNILGIVDILKNSENKQEDYAQMETYLQQSADELDKAIKSISEKLNEE